MSSTPIQSPTAYVVSRAVAFADTDGSMMLVSATAPLPVLAVTSSGTSTPLAGTASASGVFGPFTLITGRSVMLSLQGTWSGTVKVLRSTDNGASKLPLTAGGVSWGTYSGNCCEAVWEESDSAAKLYLDIALTSGSVTYRMAQ
jgi:hypothetical protein